MFFTCGKCKREWHSEDKSLPEESREGYRCPECGSIDVSGKLASEQ